MDKSTGCFCRRPGFVSQDLPRVFNLCTFSYNGSGALFCVGCTGCVSMLAGRNSCAYKYNLKKKKSVQYWLDLVLDAFNPSRGRQKQVTLCEYEVYLRNVRNKQRKMEAAKLGLHREY